MSNITPNFKQSYDRMSTALIPLCVIDRTLTTTNSAYTSPLGTISVYPDFSNLDTSLDFIENWGYYVDFGDGTVVKSLTASHFYNFPGQYSVTLVVSDSASNYFTSTDIRSITVKDVIQDSIFITPISGEVIQSGSLNSPLLITRYNSYQTFPTLSSVGYTINLSISGNRSKFTTFNEYESSKYSHLNSNSIFISGSNDNIIPCDKLQTNSVMLYAQAQPLSLDIILTSLPGNFIEGLPVYFVGTSGTAILYYYEDFKH